MDWSLNVLVCGQDVTSKITSTIKIEAEESTARTATFTIRPADGVIDVNAWFNAPVSIDFITLPATTDRVFTGKVSEPVYSPVTKLVTFNCTDDLQGHFNDMSEAQILAAIPGGRYNGDVFGARESGWQQAQDVLSTVTGSYDLGRFGNALYTAWAANPVADFSFTASNADDVSLELVRQRDMINTVNFTAKYRFVRLHHREHDFLWEWPGLCEYLGQSHELPTRSMVEAAADGMHWKRKRKQICFKTLPDSGVYCSGQNWSVTEELQNQLCTSASWRGARRWAQDVTESYDLTLTEAGSVAQYGQLLLEDAADSETKYSSASWEASLDTEDPAFLGGSLEPYDPNGCGSGSLASAPGNSWTWGDKDSAATVTGLIETLLQHGSHLIKGSHRRNYVSWLAAIIPTLELSHTAEISAEGISAKGKVHQYIHDIDIKAGTALTTVKIAISRVPAGGSEDALTAPARPVTDAYVVPAASTIFDTHIGNSDVVANYDADWSGFTGNYSVAVGSPTEDQVYPRRFRAVGPDIEAAADDEIIATTVGTYNVQVPNETLTVTV